MCRSGVAPDETIHLFIFIKWDQIRNKPESINKIKEGSRELQTSTKWLNRNSLTTSNKNDSIELKSTFPQKNEEQLFVVST